MRKKTCLFVFCIIVVLFQLPFTSVSYSNVHVLMPHESFMGIKWGQSFDTVQDLVLLPGWQEVFQKAGILVYSRPSDELEFGGAKLEAIHYLFTASGFWLGEMLAIGEKNRDAILKSLMSLYGTPLAETVDNGQATAYLWSSSEILGEIGIFSTYNHENKEMMIQFACRQ